MLSMTCIEDTIVYFIFTNLNMAYDITPIFVNQGI